SSDLTSTISGICNRATQASFPNFRGRRKSATIMHLSPMQSGLPQSLSVRTSSCSRRCPVMHKKQRGKTNLSGPNLRRRTSLGSCENISSARYIACKRKQKREQRGSCLKWLQVRERPLHLPPS